LQWAGLQGPVLPEEGTMLAVFIAIFMLAETKAHWLWWCGFIMVLFVTFVASLHGAGA
jgi:hypothetical protein